MRKPFILFAVLAIVAACTGEKTSSPANKLQFKPDGTFKIVQFTDIHIDWAKQDCLKNTLEQMSAMLDIENPDLVVLTGDIVTKSASDSSWHAILTPLQERSIPFVVTYGNHDREQDNPTMDLADIIMSYPNSLNTAQSGTLDDQALEIFSSDGSKVAALIYAMDSNDYSTVHTTGGYGWFTPSQVNWYRETSLGYNRSNNGVPLPALAFFHIALPEHNEAYNVRHMSGIRGENECPGKINSGMFCNMLECGDVMGIFVGHDHDNDYTAVKDGIVLGFGRFSGSYLPVGKTTYINMEPGARMFVLKEGEHAFTTWKRLYGEEAGFDRETFSMGADYSLHEATKLAGIISGLRVSMNGEEAGIVPSPDIWDGSDVEQCVYDGYLYVPESGMWTLYVDGSGTVDWTIDDVKVISDEERLDCWRTFNLEKGLHPVHIEYNPEDSQRLLFRWHNIYDARFLPITEEYWFTEKSLSEAKKISW